MALPRNDFGASAEEAITAWLQENRKGQGTFRLIRKTADIAWDRPGAKTSNLEVKARRVCMDRQRRGRRHRAVMAITFTPAQVHAMARGQIDEVVELVVWPSLFVIDVWVTPSSVWDKFS